MGMLNNLGMAQETVDLLLPRLDELLQINGKKSVMIMELSSYEKETNFDGCSV